MDADGEDDQALTERFQIRLSAEQKAAFQKAARRQGLSVSGWLRQLGLIAVEQDQRKDRR